MARKILSIIIPVYNEETFVSSLLEKLTTVPFGEHGRDTQWIIVNDGSKDSSQERIQAFIKDHPHQSILYHYQDNAGKGAAVKKWFSLATGEVMVIQDADLEYDPIDLLEGLFCMEKNSLDVIYGSRIRGFQRHGFTYSTLPFLLGGLAVSCVSSLLTGRLISDEPTCYKMFKKTCHQYLLLPSENGFEWEPATTVLLLRKGMRYGERPIRYYPRKTTAGKKIKLKDGFIALGTLLKWRVKKITT